MRCQPYYVYDNSMLHGPAATLAVQFRPTAFGRRHSSCPSYGAIDSLFSPSSASRIIESFETPRFASRVIARVAISRGLSQSLRFGSVENSDFVAQLSHVRGQWAFSSRRILRDGVEFSRWVIPRRWKLVKDRIVREIARDSLFRAVVSKV